MSVYQQFIEDKVKQGVAPGFVGTVFDRNGVVWSGAAGHHTVPGSEAAPEGKKMSTETVHWMASASKISISIIVLALLDKGLVSGWSLDDLDNHEKLIKVLPEFKVGSGSLVSKIIEGYGPVGADGKREMKLRDAKSEVTLRHLLTHSAGMAYYWNHPHMVEYYQPSEGEAHGILAFVSGRIADFEVPRVREAGEEHCYQPATDWLGQFATRASGKNLPTLFRELILTPLGLTESEMAIQNSKIIESGKDISGFHVRGPGGDQGPDFINIPLPVYQCATDDPPEGQAHFASAAIYTTVPTYSNFLRACLNHDSKLLSEKAWKLGEEDPWNGKVAMPYPYYKTGRPDLTYDIDEFAPSTATGKGYCVTLLQQNLATAPTKSGRPAGSYAWAGLGNSYYFVDPITGIGSLISTQVLPFADPKLMQLKDEWEQLVYQQQAKK